MTTVQSAITAVTQHLRQGGVPDAPRDARLIVAHVLGIDRTRLTMHAPDPMPAPDHSAAMALAERRCNREPLSHILGQRAFFGRQFVVTPDVLDPRPETETLVAEALKLPFKTVLDLGTGSGCILISLLAERPGATGTGGDLSAHALTIATQNATALGVADRATLIESNWFSAITGRFDLIVANPPYIAADEMPALQPEVRNHEPRMALTDDGDGLMAYRAICDAALHHLNPGGGLMVEIGPTQGKAVGAMMQAAGLENISIHPDLDGRDRVVAAYAPG